MTEDSDIERPERPDKGATAAEIARWMEEDFEAAVAQGMIEGLKEDKEDE